MATPYKDRKIPDPLMNIGDEHYYEAAGQGKLLLKKCADCGEVHYYPRGVCPFCLSDKVSWHEAKGTGTVYTYSVTRRGGPVPYCIAYVTLDEGVSMMRAEGQGGLQEERGRRFDRDVRARVVFPRAYGHQGAG